MKNEKNLLLKYVKLGLITKEDALYVFNILVQLRKNGLDKSVDAVLKDEGFLIEDLAGLNGFLETKSEVDKIHNELNIDAVPEYTARPKVFSKQIKTPQSINIEKKSFNNAGKYAAFALFFVFLCFIVFLFMSQKNNKKSDQTFALNDKIVENKRVSTIKDNETVPSKNDSDYELFKPKEFITHCQEESSSEEIISSLKIDFDGLFGKGDKVKLKYAKKADTNIKNEVELLAINRSATGLVPLPKAFSSRTYRDNISSDVFELNVSVVVSRNGHKEMIYEQEVYWEINLPNDGKKNSSGIINITEANIGEEIDNFIISEDKQYLYLWSEGQDKLVVYNIQKDIPEKIIKVSKPKFVLNRGEKVFVANFGEGTISIYDIKKDWALTSILNFENKFVYHIAAPSGPFFKGEIFVTAGRNKAEAHYQANFLESWTKSIVNIGSNLALSVDYRGEYALYFDDFAYNDRDHSKFFKVKELLAATYNDLPKPIEGTYNSLPVVKQFGETQFWFDRGNGLYWGIPIGSHLITDEGYLIPIECSQNFISLKDGILSVNELSFSHNQISKAKYQAPKPIKDLIYRISTNWQGFLMNNIAVAYGKDAILFIGDPKNKKVYFGVVKNFNIKDETEKSQKKIETEANHKEILIKNLETKGPVSCMSITNDNNYLIIGMKGLDKVHVIETSTNKVFDEVFVPSPNFILVRGDNIFVASCEDGSVTQLSIKEKFQPVNKFIFEKGDKIYLTAPSGLYFKDEFICLVGNSTSEIKTFSCNIKSNKISEIKRNAKSLSLTLSYTGQYIHSQKDEKIFVYDNYKDENYIGQGFHAKIVCDAYQIRDDDNWFRPTKVQRGIPFNENDSGDIGIVVPDLIAKIVYGFKKGVVTAYSLDLESKSISSKNYTESNSFQVSELFNDRDYDIHQRPIAFTKGKIVKFYFYNVRYRNIVTAETGAFDKNEEVKIQTKTKTERAEFNFEKLPVDFIISNLAISEKCEYLYLANMQMNKVYILNIAENKLIKAIDVLRPLFMLARQNKLFVISAGSGLVNVFSVKNDWCVDAQIDTKELDLTVLFAPIEPNFDGQIVGKSNRNIILINTLKNESKILKTGYFLSAEVSANAAYINEVNSNGQGANWFNYFSYIQKNFAEKDIVSRSNITDLYQVRNDDYWYNNYGVYTGFPMKKVTDDLQTVFYLPIYNSEGFNILHFNKIDSGFEIGKIERRSSIKSNNIKLYTANLLDGYKGSNGDIPYVNRLENKSYAIVENNKLCFYLFDELRGQIVYAKEGGNPVFIDGIIKKPNSETNIENSDVPQVAKYKNNMNLVTTMNTEELIAIENDITTFKNKINELPLIVRVKENDMAVRNYFGLQLDSLSILSSPEKSEIFENKVFQWKTSHEDIGEHEVKIKVTYKGAVFFDYFKIEIIDQKMVEILGGDLSKLNDIKPLKFINYKFKMFYSQNRKQLFCVEQKMLTCVNSTTLLIENQYPLTEEYILILDRENYFVALSIENLNLINKADGHIIRSIPFTTGKPISMALVPNSNFCFVSLLDNTTNYGDGTNCQIVQINEKNGQITAFKGFFGDYIYIDKKGENFFAISSQVKPTSFVLGKFLVTNVAVNPNALKESNSYKVLLMKFKIGSKVMEYSGSLTFLNTGPANILVHIEDRITPFMEKRRDTFLSTSFIDMSKLTYYGKQYDFNVEVGKIRMNPAYKIIAGMGAKEVSFINKETGENLGKLIDDFPEHINSLLQIEFSPNGEFIHLLYSTYNTNCILVTKKIKIPLNIKKEETINIIVNSKNEFNGINKISYLSNFTGNFSGVEIFKENDFLKLINFSSDKKVANFETGINFEKYLISIKSDGRALGSGFFITSDGVAVIPLSHLNKQTELKVYYIGINGVTYSGEAKLIGQSESNNLALIRVDVKQPVNICTFKNTKFEVKESLVVIGEPVNENNSLKFRTSKCISKEINTWNNSRFAIKSENGLPSFKQEGVVFDSYGNICGFTTNLILDDDTACFSIKIIKAFLEQQIPK